MKKKKKMKNRPKASFMSFSFDLFLVFFWSALLHFFLAPEIECNKTRNLFHDIKKPKVVIFFRF